MKKTIWNILVIFLVIIAITGDIWVEKDKDFYIKPKNGEWQKSYNIIPNIEKNKLYTSAFKFCWEEFSNSIGNKVELVNQKPIQQFEKFETLGLDINSDDYYIKSGKMTYDLKNQIENEVKQKFKFDDVILKSLNFTDALDSNKYLLYSILKKNFVFAADFDVMPDDSFGNSKTKYKYFGLNNALNSNDKYTRLTNSIDYLFYFSPSDFAIKILNKDKTEEMILYLTNSRASLDTLYKEVISRTEKFNFTYRNDRLAHLKQQYENTLQNKAEVYIQTYLKIPYLKINEIIEFPEFENVQIKGNNFENDKNDILTIEKAVQIINFDLDNNGNKSADNTQKTNKNGVEFKIIISNSFDFNRPFVLFLKKTNSDKPYFAARIKDDTFLIRD